jgi:hypothetical protein
MPSDSTQTIPEVGETRWISTSDAVPAPSAVVLYLHVHWLASARLPSFTREGVTDEAVVTAAENRPTSTLTGVLVADVPSNSTHHMTGTMPVVVGVAISTIVFAVAAVSAMPSWEIE